MAVGRSAGKSRAKSDHIAPFAPRCPANKVGFLRKKDARKFADQRGLPDLRAYRCNHRDCDYWHLGHLPTIVVAGVLDRHDLDPVIRSGRSKPCPRP